MFFMVGQTGGNSLTFLRFFLYGSVGFSIRFSGLSNATLLAF